MIAGIQEMISHTQIFLGHRTPTPTYKQFKKHAALFLGSYLYVEVYREKKIFLTFNYLGIGAVHKLRRQDFEDF